MSASEAPLFTDRKDPGALRTIGEVADALSIKQHVLRYWEEQFPMLKPLKRSGGRRYYRSEDVAMVETIDRLVHREGYTLKGAKAVLSGRGAVASAPVALPVMEAAPAGTGVSLERLVAIRNKLVAALNG
jgi:DNA-binding transcriptional MerR regulator